MKSYNNIKLSFREPTFVVDSKNGVVICKLKFTSQVPYINDLVVYPSKEWPNPLCTLEVKGVAFTNKGDTFDETIGKKVALAKAENKAYNYVFNYYKRGLKDLFKALDVLEDFAYKVQRVVEHNVEYIKKF